MDKQNLLNGSYFSLDSDSGIKFRLKDRNWNDFGYYTLYSLEMKLPDSSVLYSISDIRIMNINQKIGEKPSWIPTTPAIFISNIESAERLFLFLSPFQRLQLQDILTIRYRINHIQSETVFIKSILRNKTLDEFISVQGKIRELMQSPLNVHSMLLKNKEQFCSLMENINT